jgi:ketosteroid isomerase-like protein
MSQENVDRFLESAAAFNRGDVEEALQGFDTDVVFEPQVSVVEGAFTGLDGVRAFLTGSADLYEVFQVDYSEVRDLGDRVLAFGTARSTGKESGIETGVPLAVVANFRDGLCTRWKDYGDRDQALEALGLTE